MSSITLYTTKVEIALVEAEAKFKSYQIDLRNKPEWYMPQMYLLSPMVALMSGVPHENPSAESVKLAESLILIEFIADLFPEANLVPKDPVLRAQARFFAEVVNSKFVPAFKKFVLREVGYGDLLTAAEAIQTILLATGSYAVGDRYNIADIAITSFLARLKVASTNEVGDYPLGHGSELLRTLSGEKYAKFNGYAERLLNRKSCQATFDAECIKGSLA